MPVCMYGVRTVWTGTCAERLKITGLLPVHVFLNIAEKAWVVMSRRAARGRDGKGHSDRGALVCVGTVAADRGALACVGTVAAE